MTGTLIRLRHTEGQSCEEVGKRQTSTQQEESASQEPANTSISDSQLPHGEPVNVPCASCPDCGPLCSSQDTDHWAGRVVSRAAVLPPTLLLSIFL